MSLSSSLMRSLCLDTSRKWRRQVTPVEFLGRYFNFSAESHSNDDLSSLPSSSSSGPVEKNTLYSRILPIRDPTAPIFPVLDQWREQGRSVDTAVLFRILKHLRSYRRYNHALQISEWMDKKLKFSLPPRDIAIRMDLILKVHGLEQAEKYFDTIPENQRGLEVYGALLHCYARVKSLEKAEATMQKLRDLGFARKSLPFNAMLNLYSQMGETDKLDMILQEMEEKGIPYDEYTYSTRLNAYIAASDVEGMERFLVKMESRPQASVHWNAYVVAANGYQKAGFVDKAIEMLKKAEKHVKGEDNKSAYEHLISLYAGMGQKDEVYRIWNLCKAMGKVSNMGYLCVVSALLKLDYIDGAEKLVEEWEFGKNKLFDFRIPNVLISAYCKKGLLDKAEAYVNRLVQDGKEPNASTWDRLATGYCQANQMEKAVEAMKKGFMASCRRWKPNPVAIARCVEFLRETDQVKAEEFIKLLKERCKIPRGVAEGSLNYMSTGERGAGAFEHK